MTRPAEPWRAAYRLLRRRADRAPLLARAAAIAAPPTLHFDAGGARETIVTGVGSSGAHAKLLAHLLADTLCLPARYVAPGALDPVREPGERALIVFSQGLSPNARLVLRDLRRWLGVVLVTAITPAAATTDTRRLLAELDAAGGSRLLLRGGAERGTLLRVAGPLAGYAAAYRLAAAIGHAAGARNAGLDLDADGLAGSMARAIRRARALAASGDPLRGAVALVASGGYGELADNLRLKIVEGLFEPLPPVADLLEFAHGPFQALYERETTSVLLERSTASGEAALVHRFTRMLDPQRHRVLRLSARGAGALALFEHEVMLNELVLASIAVRRLDQANWPGRGRELPLYTLGAPASRRAADARAGAGRNAKRGRGGAARNLPTRSPRAASHALATLTWPEVEARLAGGRRTVVIPLGSTEQHGPHLPYATDSLIAEALAEGVSARLDAVWTPVVAIGCAAEHGGFPGSLSLGWDTLRAVLVEQIGALVRHGFASVFVFSAHGGNAGVLRATVAELTAAARPASLTVATDLAGLTPAWHRIGAASGVGGAAGGHHAGEIETSIVMALSPGLVRHGAVAPGLLAVSGDPQAVFYPDLRRRAANGVVGDPRGAEAARGRRYLAAWVDHLITCYERGQRTKRKKTYGAQKA